MTGQEIIDEFNNAKEELKTAKKHLEQARQNVIFMHRGQLDRAVADGFLKRSGDMYVNESLKIELDKEKVFVYICPKPAKNSSSSKVILTPRITLETAYASADHFAKTNIEAYRALKELFIYIPKEA